MVTQPPQQPLALKLLEVALGDSIGANAISVVTILIRTHIGAYNAARATHQLHTTGWVLA